MKKEITIGLTIFLLGGCSLINGRQERMAQARARYEANTPEAQKVSKETAARLAMNCGINKAGDLDDGVSDASTIAAALASVCDREYENYVDATVKAAEANQAVRGALRDRMMSRGWQMDFFLPLVLSRRRSERP